MKTASFLAAVLLSGCVGATSEEDTRFLHARATAAVAFAEAELAISSEEPASVVEQPSSADAEPHRRRLLYFTASWCSSCRTNEATLAALAAAGWKIGPSDRDHIQVIDVDASPAVAQQYRIAAVPEWVLIDSGIAVRRAIGFLDPFAVGRLFDDRARLESRRVRFCKTEINRGRASKRANGDRDITVGPVGRGGAV